MTSRPQTINSVRQYSNPLTSADLAQSQNLDESWAVLTHSSIAGESNSNSPSPLVIQPSNEKLPDVETLRQKFKESRVVLATVPLHLSNLSPEQILEINFLAGALVSRNPTIATDKLVADLATLYSNKSDEELAKELTRAYFG